MSIHIVRLRFPFYRFCCRVLGQAEPCIDSRRSADRSRQYKLVLACLPIVSSCPERWMPNMSSKKKSYYSDEMINEICEEIDRQWNYHGRVRASFPATAGHIAHWLNQNYIVRLCGILDEYQVITKGKQDGNDFTLVLAGLRHRVGAHTRGYWDPENSDDRDCGADS
jgi:hypothetical protein